jgi:hypothetical protein
VGLALETLDVEFVDVLRAGRARVTQSISQSVNV